MPLGGLLPGDTAQRVLECPEKECTIMVPHPVNKAAVTSLWSTNAAPGVKERVSCVLLMYLWAMEGMCVAD